MRADVLLTNTAATLVLACGAIVLAPAATAQVRVEPAVAAIQPGVTPMATGLFGRGGAFLIAGGVVLHGNARFLVEQNGHDQAVPATDVTLVSQPGGSAGLRYGGQVYTLQMPQGLACPLAEFTQRGGLIAYTVPKIVDPNSIHLLRAAGVVRHRIAREFDGSGFEPLLRAADFAESEPLPQGVGSSIAASINATNGIGAFLASAAVGLDNPVGSYINSDFQVTYAVYMMTDQNRVEVAGVPLRYYWALTNSSWANVFSVEALSQAWPSGTRLTFQVGADTRPTQYDVINFYQVAGVFHQLDQTAPASFDNFVQAACAH